MRLGDRQLGKPETLYTGEQAAIEALTPEAGQFAYASDIFKIGYYNGSGWTWSNLSGGSGSTTPLSDATPEPTGTAAAGTSGSAARGDHVHALETVDLTKIQSLSAYRLLGNSGSASSNPGQIELGNGLDFNAGNLRVTPTSGSIGYSLSAGNADLLDGEHAGAFADASHTHAGGDIVSAVGSAGYATTSASAGYATTSGSASYATHSGSAGYATNSGSAGYATNADTVDGLHAASFVLTSDYEDADVLTKIKNVDGVGSGLDADLLDGYSSGSAGADAHIPITSASGGLTITGGLNLGTAGSAAAGDVKMSGTIRESYPIACKAKRTTAATIPNNAWTAISMESAIFEQPSDLDMWNVGSNPSRLTCKVAGIYLIVASMKITGNTTGIRGVCIYLNNSRFLAQDTSNNLGSTNFVMSCATVQSLAVNDYVECKVYQNSGGNLDLFITDDTTSISFVKLA